MKSKPCCCLSTTTLVYSLRSQARLAGISPRTPSRTPCMPLDATADAPRHRRHPGGRPRAIAPRTARVTVRVSSSELAVVADTAGVTPLSDAIRRAALGRRSPGNTRIPPVNADAWQRSEEHTSELQSLMRISYAVFCLQQKKIN